MATEKVGVYRKYHGPVPKDKLGQPLPKSKWPKKRAFRWAVRWFGSDGKRYSKSFEKRKEADRYALALQKQVNLGKSDRPQKLLLHEFIREHEKVMKGQVAYATLQDQIRAMRLFADFVGSSIGLCKIQPRHAEAFIAERLSSGLSPATINKDIRTLRRIFDLAVEPRGYLEEGQNPFAKIKQRKKAQNPIRYVSVDEYKRIRAIAKDLWWETLISVAYGSGLRRNEILNLTWADIDFENQLIRVAVKKGTAEALEWEPKDHENRVVPMSDESSQLLANLHSQAEDAHPYIFISPSRYEQIKQRRAAGDWNERDQLVNNLIRDFDVIRCRAAVPKCTLHDLRRSAITNWARVLPIHIVQKLAGHSDIKTTQQYYLAIDENYLERARSLQTEILRSNLTDPKLTHSGKNEGFSRAKRKIA